MDEKTIFQSLLSNKKEEEKQFFFDDDEDEEKISFTGYRRNIETDHDMFAIDQDDCSDCDKDCRSQIMAERPTNDSNSYIYDPDEEDQEAMKYLTRLGLLERIDNNCVFEVDEEMEQPSLTYKVYDDYELCSSNYNLDDSQNYNKIGGELFEDVGDCMDIDEMSRKERELLELGLPALEVDEDEYVNHQLIQNNDVNMLDSTNNESGHNSRHN